MENLSKITFVQKSNRYTQYFNLKCGLVVRRMDHLYINRFNRSDTYHVYVSNPTIDFFNFTQFSKWKRYIELLAPMRIVGYKIRSRQALRFLFDNVGEAATFIKRVAKNDKEVECDIEIVQKTFILG